MGVWVSKGQNFSRASLQLCSVKDKFMVIVNHLGAFVVVAENENELCCFETKN